MKKNTNTALSEIITAASLAALLTLTGCASASQQTTASSGQSVPPQTVSAPWENQLQTVTVNSTEKVTVTPDIAEIVYSVQTQAPEAEACQQKNTEETDRVIALLKENGVKETSIQTTGYRLDPQYDWSSDRQVLAGYEARTTLTVSDLPIDQVGTLLSQSVSAGINNIESISYLSSQYDASYQEALGLAVAAAQSKAQAMAEAAGYDLGYIADMQEISSYSSARYNDTVLLEKTREGSAADMAAGSVTVMPGELEVEASVMVQYTIWPRQ